jgi:hypothetical protein
MDVKFEIGWETLLKNTLGNTALNDCTFKKLTINTKFNQRIRLKISSKFIKLEIVNKVKLSK